MFRWQYAKKHCVEFTKSEFYSFITTIAVAGFLLSFRMWGAETFDLAQGLYHFTLYTILFGALYFLFIISQKYVGALMGYETRYHIWKYGPLVAFLISMYLVLFLPHAHFVVLLYLGATTIKDVPRLRLGEFRKSVNIFDLMLVGLSGPAILLLFILFVLQPVYLATGGEIVRIMIIFSAMALFFSSLPFPYMNGLNILIKSRVGWLIYFFFSIFFLILILALNIWAYIVAVVLALIFVWLFRKYVFPRILHGS